MFDFLRSSTAELALAFAGCAMLVTLGAYVIRRCRQMMEENSSNTNEIMCTFQELYQQGELSEQEYKNIKNRLANRLQHEFKNAGQKS